MKYLHKLMSGLLVSMLCLMVSAPASAAMVGTDTLIDRFESVDRAALSQLVSRQEFQQQLVEMGVDPVAAEARVARLTAAEMAQFNQRLAEMPAGGDGLGTLVFIFVVFVITDVIGATDIFPFIKSIKTTE